MTPKPAVFLDKDGTLITDIPYNVAPEHIHLTRGAVEGLRALQEAGYLLVILSNQSGVARGIFPEVALRGVEDYLRKTLSSRYGIELAGFYYCPHHPHGRIPRYAFDCACRKPRPGMFYQAARGLGIDLGASWMVGDLLDDVEAGHRAGCRSILIDNGNETEWVGSPWRNPEYVARDLDDASRMVTIGQKAVRPAARIATHTISESAK